MLSSWYRRYARVREFVTVSHFSCIQVCTLVYYLCILVALNRLKVLGDRRKKTLSHNFCAISPRFLLGMTIPLLFAIFNLVLLERVLRILFFFYFSKEFWQRISWLIGATVKILAVRCIEKWRTGRRI